MSFPPERIRNFCVIAHVDHGKSTLSDRLIELCGHGEKLGHDRLLDRLDLERERGITIKAQAVSLDWRAPDGQTYRLNLIDTPGHVDFSYEVSRSLAACEGAILLVDASQGVEAQTVANCYAAAELGLEILVVLNKIDVPHADPDKVAAQIEDVIGIDASGAIAISAREGTGVESVLEAVVQKVPPPAGDPAAPMRALVIDSWFDPYEGVISLVRVVDGQLRLGDRVRLLSTDQDHRVEDLSMQAPERVRVQQLECGMVAALAIGAKELTSVPVGDTLAAADVTPPPQPLPGFAQVRPRIFAGLYPVSSEDFEAFRTALGKLRLNDAAVTAEPESSDVLGFGFRCGFLGTLHMEVVRDRLEREFNLELIATEPMVEYQVMTTAGEELLISNPSRLPPRQKISTIAEPMAAVRVITGQEYLGSVIELCQSRRGRQTGLNFSASGAVLEVRIPMPELLVDFSDRLKSVSRGYASFDYQPDGYEVSELDRLDVLINGQRIDSLASVVHRSQLSAQAREIAARLKEVIPRQMFEVPIQLAVGGRILARETVKAMRKNVTAKCYGGDITRKKKLLERQKAGKKRMKQIGNVEIPPDAFRGLVARRS